MEMGLELVHRPPFTGRVAEHQLNPIGTTCCSRARAKLFNSIKIKYYI